MGVDDLITTDVTGRPFTIVEKGRPLTELKRAHDIQCTGFFGAILVALYIFSYLTGCNVISFFG